MTAAQVQRRLNKLDGMISDVLSEMESLKNEMQEHFDDKSENWQEGEKGQEWQEKIDSLEDAHGDLVGVRSTVLEVID